jgi:hypothetical protein
MPKLPTLDIPASLDESTVSLVFRCGAQSRRDSGNTRLAGRCSYPSIAQAIAAHGEQPRLWPAAVGMCAGVQTGRNNAGTVHSNRIARCATH